MRSDESLEDRTIPEPREDGIAQVVNGKYTARIDEPCVVFIIGMWLPYHK